MALLIRSMPFYNESLSSYLYRISYKNYCSVSWLLEKLNISSIITRNTDLIKKQNTIDNIARYLGIDTQAVNNMTLRKYPVHQWGAYRFRLSSSQDINNFFNFKPKFCPFCLMQEKYIRLHWYFKTLGACDVHGVIMLDKCDTCGKMVNHKNITISMCDCGRNLDLIAGQSINSEYYTQFDRWETWVYKEILKYSQCNK